MFIISRVFLNVMFSVQIKGEYSGGMEGFFCITWASLSKVGHIWTGLPKCFHLEKWLQGVYIHTHKCTHTHSDIKSTIILCTTKYLAKGPNVTGASYSFLVRFFIKIKLTFE